MIFAESTTDYYFKYYDIRSRTLYDARYFKKDILTYNNVQKDMFKTMIEMCIDTENYDICINEDSLTCVFICDTNVTKKRIIIYMYKTNDEHNLCNNFLAMDI